jgi:hypothetical protein
MDTLSDDKVAELASLLNHGEEQQECTCHKCLSLSNGIKQALKHPQICCLCNLAMGRSNSIAFAFAQSEDSIGVAHANCVEQHMGQMPS